MSVESGSTRNTLGSQLSTTSSASQSSGSSKGTPSRKKEYWKKDRKFIRILTVAAYIASVSMAAVLLSTYYVFIWTADSPNSTTTQWRGRGPNRYSSRSGPGGGGSSSSRLNTNSVTQPSAYAGPGGVFGVVPLPGQGTTPINQFDDGGEDEDEFQQRSDGRRRGYSRKGNRRFKQKGNNAYSNTYYSHQIPRHDEDEYGEERDTDVLSSGEAADPIALPLLAQMEYQNPMTLSLSVASGKTTNTNEERNESDTRILSTSSSRTTTNSVDTGKPFPYTYNYNYNYANSGGGSGAYYDEPEYESSSNTTRPYRQRQIPTPSAPIPITKTISAFVLEPTTTAAPSTSQLSYAGSSDSSSSPLPSSQSRSPTATPNPTSRMSITITTTQPMISLLWNASKLSATATQQSNQQRTV